MGVRGDASSSRRAARPYSRPRRAAPLGPLPPGCGRSHWWGTNATSPRRVPGLRREEVAVLAGVSTEWHTRLETGHIARVSGEVLDAVAGALQLDEAEHA
jgi:transcriptional regulator with XRE-family HTH domain